jgi:hypothetical protein
MEGKLAEIHLVKRKLNAQIDIAEDQIAEESDL